MQTGMQYPWALRDNDCLVLLHSSGEVTLGWFLYRAVSVYLMHTIHEHPVQEAVGLSMFRIFLGLGY